MKEIEFTHITTKGGDGGKTSLLNGERRSKADFIFEVLGDIDEFSSALGLARAHLANEQKVPSSMLEHFIKIQDELIQMGGHISTPPSMEPYSRISDSALHELELSQQIYIKDLEIKGFIRPGASPGLAAIDLARSIVRRAERHLVSFIQDSHAIGHEHNQKYLNRLSDYLFICARYLAKVRNLKE